MNGNDTGPGRAVQAAPPVTAGPTTTAAPTTTASASAAADRRVCIDFDARGGALLTAFVGPAVECQKG
ncbi:hypothetical protein [Pseudonocardia oroxyli]|uniref:Uncharacterized protein n=1 Tax=Pseudonocardia oroxyli TaxID=366584 RepID=A0A1G7TUV6_PSEOR|nr:hypothetical protein [Pseudonocardia oroxyli]SDG39043.1 hypothetical protein SAMN05216377_111143 [Pseudonocardia oroxyli]